MPKKSVAVRNQKRQKKVAQSAELHTQLKKEKNYEALDKFSKNALPVRLRKRCFSCQRSRGIIISDKADEVKGGEKAICRICFRDMASQGLIPGFRKASW